MKVTGHLCSVSFREAAEMGIDNLEHGPFIAPDSEFYSKRKRPGSCTPMMSEIYRELAGSVDPNGLDAQLTIRSLVSDNADAPSHQASA